MSEFKCILRGAYRKKNHISNFSTVLAMVRLSHGCSVFEVNMKTLNRNLGDNLKHSTYNLRFVTFFDSEHAEYVSPILSH